MTISAENLQRHQLIF